MRFVSFVLWLLLLFNWFNHSVAQTPRIRIHRGYISVQDALYSQGTTEPYTINAPYTFELYMDDTVQHDYVIESCTMNSVQFIGSYGCVQCGNNVLQSVETEQYTRAGAIKRTLVHFNAPTDHIYFVCQVKVLDCSGCAERSCERRPPLAGIMAHPIPITCGIIGLAPMAPVAIAPVAVGMVGYQTPVVHQHAYSGVGIGRNWLADCPWWLWLLLALFLLLLLLCCLACLIWAFCGKKKRRQEKVTTTRIATVEENKAVGIGVGTESTIFKEKGVGTNGSLYKESIIQEKTERIIPAYATDDGYHTHSRDHREESLDATYTRVGARNGLSRERERHDEHYDTYGRERNAGSYSVREGRIVNERFTRNYPPQQPSPPHMDRSSYRNYAYERDMGRVAPMSGFDEVETLERRYCMSDDDSDIVEKDIKRTHTTRFVQETRTIHDDQHSDDSAEKYREEQEQHVVYAPHIHRI